MSFRVIWQIKFALLVEPLINSLLDLLVGYGNRLCKWIIFNLSVQDQTEGDKNSKIKISTLQLIYNLL